MSSNGFAAASLPFDVPRASYCACGTWVALYAYAASSCQPAGLPALATRGALLLEGIHWLVRVVQEAVAYF